MRIRGALYGSLLFDRPEHAATREAIVAFASQPGPLGVEIGFDHGMCILDRARSFPGWRHLGVEIRKRRVANVAPHAPPNCLLAAVDGRTLLGSLLPPGSVAALYILFPTPGDLERHRLLSPDFAEAVARSLAIGGKIWFATDVPELVTDFDRLFPWTPTAPPPLGTALSRRERVCSRDGIPVHRRCVSRPVGDTSVG